MNEIFDLANYYAIELLNSILNKDNPTDFEIISLEEKLRQKNCQLYRYLYMRKNQPTALIISPDIVEQNTLRIMLESLGFKIHQVYNRKELLDYFSYKHHCHIALVSDAFTEIGFNFFRYYFEIPSRKTFLIQFGEQNNNFKKMGFDANLKRLFFREELISLLPKHLLAKSSIRNRRPL